VRGDRAALEKLALVAREERLSPHLLYVLAMALEESGGDPDPVLQSAQERFPADFWLNYSLGTGLLRRGKPEEAMGYLRAALALRPNCSMVYTNLGTALKGKGQVEEALACFHKALALDPKLAVAHNNLGVILCDVKHDYDGALACQQKALALDPKDAKAHLNLGLALAHKGQLEEAIACFHKALALDPNFAEAHFKLGIALTDKGQMEEAIACYQKVIALDPKHAWAHYNLGNALKAKGQVEEAIACYHKALALEPKHAWAHNNLGNALKDKGQVEEAIACYHKALAIDPKLAAAHFNLGLALRDKGQVEEAIACYQKVIALDPKLAEAHDALGWSLLRQGRFPQAEASIRRALDLLPSGHPLRPVVSQRLQQCQRWLALEQKLPAVLSGPLPGSAAERLDYAQLCALTRRHQASARLYTEAFHADAKLSDPLQTVHRYNAACGAAQAGCGKGTDAGPLDDQERARLRRQALDWLRADLAVWARQAANDKETDRARVRRALGRWQRDPDLSGLRDAPELAKLPSDEQEACRKLWADVEALLKKVP
jgi:tetratricopeptide (TPR) repeat protein